MLVAFTFRARPGKERDFEAMLNDPDGARRISKLMGATRNTLFLGGGRMVRVLEFPEGTRPVPLPELARSHADIQAFLQKMGPLIQDGFDVDRPGSLEAFNERAMVPLAFDVPV